jgi:hypothetical protein
MPKKTRKKTKKAHHGVLPFSSLKGLPPTPPIADTCWTQSRQRVRSNRMDFCIRIPWLVAQVETIILKYCKAGELERKKRSRKEENRW